MNPSLELFLITYNRKEKCKQTLDVLLGEHSPVKNLPITVLDNCSTDGTSEMLAEFANKHATIRLVRHEKNIGGNANAARAFEMARADYVWVLCDDDKYDFSNWAACEKALKTHPAAVVVANYVYPEKGIAYLFRQLFFVPGAIYRTDLITSDVLMNMYFSISNMFPQLAVAAAAINSGEQLVILDKPLVSMQFNTDASHIRGTSAKNHAHPLMAEMFWTKGYLRSIQLLQNKQHRAACSMLAWAEDYTGFWVFCKRFGDFSGHNFWADYTEAVHLLSGPAKWKFAWRALMLHYLIRLHRNDKGLHVCLFNKAKIRLWKFAKQSDTEEK